MTVLAGQQMKSLFDDRRIEKCMNPMYTLLGDREAWYFEGSLDVLHDERLGDRRMHLETSRGIVG